jgi:gamma-glutamylcysteine synthetase
MDLLATGESFIEHTLRLSNAYQQYFQELPPLTQERTHQFEQEVERSILEQKRLEADNRINFDQYVAQFLGD